MITEEQQKALALARARQRKAQAANAAAPQAGDMVTDAAGNPIAQLPPRADAPPSPPVQPRSGWDRAGGLGMALGGGLAQGARNIVSTVAGAPVDILNNAPLLLNLLPGEQGFGPISDNPIGGSASINRGLRGANLGVQAYNAVFGTPDIPEGAPDWMVAAIKGEPWMTDYQPQGGIERIVNRVGQELGAMAIPVGGVIAKGASMPLATINRMAAAPASVGEGIAAQFLKPAAVNPVGLAGREAGYATAAGLGAGVANELAGENQGVGSDLLGSILGVAAGGTVAGLAGAGRNAAAGAFNTPNFADNVANSAVAEQIINSSAQMQEQAARFRELGIPLDQLSTDPLVQALRRPAAVEQAVPGYQANIADRSLDPGLATLAFNTDSRSTGAANLRRVGNERAVNDQMAVMAPAGDPSQFRADLQSGVDSRIAQVQSAQEQAQGEFDNLLQALQPVMREASARGSSIRSALADAYSRAQDQVDQLYEPVNQSDALLDPAGLVTGAKAVDMNLAPNDAKRFRPTEADTIAEMMPGSRAPLRDTGLVNEFNRPVFAENAPPRAAPTGGANGVPSLAGEAIGRPGTTVPMSDISAIRTGLTDDLRTAQKTGNTQQARVLNKYIAAIDGYLAENLPPDLRSALEQARAGRRDLGDRFERPGTALENILAKTEGGGYALNDSAVPGRIAQTDQGRLSDLRAALAEAGSDQRLRDGLADEVRSQVVRDGLLNNPAALGKYMADRQVLLSEFPELKAQLEQAGATRANLTAAEKAATETTRNLTTPGRSAEASYLKNVEDPAAAIRSVIASPNPRKAVADLVATAGTPRAKADLRAALWEEIKRSGKMQADGMTGQSRWNGKNLRGLLDDPKFAAVAQELWADDPQDLTNIKSVFDALASAEGSTRARAPGSSGTAQALSGKLDPALTASSLASRGRSISRNQLSPSIAVVDILGTWLRRRSAQVQSRAIDQITASVVNNPGLAADLLEKYNPATASARSAMLLQKYGVRVTTLVNILSEAENDDPVANAVTGEP